MLKSDILVLVVSFILSTYTICNAQNLVVDPSFENAEPYLKTGSWTNLQLHHNGISYGTSDLWSESRPELNKEGNYRTDNYSPRTGDLFLGAILIGWDKWLCRRREFFRGRLKSPLIKDETYRVSIYARLSDCYDVIPMTDIGVLLSGDSLEMKDLCSQNVRYLPLRAKTKIISKNNRWQKIEGHYTAKGGEQFIHIGGFLGSSFEAIKSAENTKGIWTYYFFDDVEVVKVSEEDLQKAQMESEEDSNEEVQVNALNQIFFAYNSDEIYESSEKLLHQISNLLKTRHDLTVAMSGHTDNAGSDGYNQELAQHRVNSVKKVLVEKGLDPNTITTSTKGSFVNIASNDTEQGRRLNRRVDIKLNYKNELEKFQLEALCDFAKLYGYVRYFYPEDFRKHLDWNSFVAYGVQKIRQSQNKSEAIQKIKDLFSKLSKQITIREELNEAWRLPPLREYKFWQHLGLQDGGNEIYESKLVNTIDKEEWLFDAEPEKRLVKDIGKTGMYYSVPLMLDLRRRFDEHKVEEFGRFVEEQLILEQDEFIANTIIVWNVIQHFYPYLEYLELDWAAFLFPKIEEVSKIRDVQDFDRFIKKLVVLIKDGHASVNHVTEATKMWLPFEMTLLNNKIEVKESGSDQILKGDIINKIDGVDAYAKFKKDTALISGSSQWKAAKGLLTLGVDQQYTTAAIEREQNEKISEIKVVRDWGKYKSKLMEEISEGVYSINLKNVVVIDAMMDVIVELENSKAIIFDVRGYLQNDFLKLLPHLMSVSDTVSNCFQTPQIVNPNQKKVTYKKEGWSLRPKSRKLPGEYYFLTDGRAISASESFISFVKHYKLGTIIGSPTAGANGSKNWIDLLAGYGFSWTGMYVTDFNNRCYHSKGIEPDVVIYPSTFEEDEILNKALELISN